MFFNTQRQLVTCASRLSAIDIEHRAGQNYYYDSTKNVTLYQAGENGPTDSKESMIMHIRAFKFS